MQNKVKETILYVLFGCFTTIINFMLFYLCHEYFAISLILSNTLAWCGAVLFAFITNQKIVFRSNGNTQSEAITFFISRIASLLLETILLLILTVLHCPAMVSKLFISIFVLVFNYVAAKYFIFTKRKEWTI